MNPLECINQLTDENAILRSQLHDAREQAKRDSETIARLLSERDRFHAAAIKVLMNRQRAREMK